MHHKEFLSQIDDAKVVAAIAEAEKRTSGEIRVWISSRKITNALETAQQRFVKLGMHKTADRNAVLIYIAPRSRAFAIIGDTGIHEKCGHAFWNGITQHFSSDLKNESVTTALLNAIHKIGELLSTHYPCQPGDKNELPNEILGD